jgi:hypothetical protein
MLLANLVPVTGQLACVYYMIQNRVLSTKTFMHVLPYAILDSVFKPRITILHNNFLSEIYLLGYLAFLLSNNRTITFVGSSRV